jgi:hypothetical protein
VARCSPFREVALAVVLALVAIGVPPALAATDEQAKPSTSSGYVDPMRDLGAASPSCRFLLRPEQRASCRRSGSAVHHYPLGSYGFDVRVGFSVTDPGKSFLGALQSLAAGLWMGLVFLLKGVLLLLEWTFALDLTGKAMPEAQQTMQRLHHRAFGEPWLITAIAVAGLWGIWRGLVQRRTTETFTGLASTVGLMVLGLLVISQPGETVGHASRLANDAGAAVLAAATTGEVDEPRASLASALAGIFDATVRDPWCALEFGSVAYCDARAKPGADVTNADLWLAYPAQSREREELFKLLKGEDLDDTGIADVLRPPALSLLGVGKDDPKLDEDVQRLVVKAPERARMQEEGGTFSRFALLAVIGLGLLGAAVLFGYLGAGLLLASVKTVVLLMFTPAVLLAAAFGDAGRALFVAWAQRLAGAIVAKLVYSLFLAVTLAACGTVSKLDLGWFGTWLLLTTFWWGIVIKRKDLIGLTSLGMPRSEGRSVGQALSQGYYGWQLGRAIRSTAGAALERPARAVAAARQQSRDTAAAHSAATAALATEQLDNDGRRALVAEHAAARAGLERRETLQRALRATDRRLQGYDESVAAARAQGHDRPAPTAEQAALLEYRDRVRGALRDPQLQQADATVRHAARNRATSGSEITDRDLASYRAARRTAAELPPDDERNLQAAGVDPAEFRTASQERRDELRGVVDEHLQRERDLLAVSDAGEHPVLRRDVGRAARWLGSDDVEDRAGDERARMRDERRRRRTRAGVYRPR